MDLPEDVLDIVVAYLPALPDRWLLRRVSRRYRECGEWGCSAQAPTIDVRKPCQESASPTCMRARLLLTVTCLSGAFPTMQCTHGMQGFAKRLMLTRPCPHFGVPSRLVPLAAK